MSFPLNITALNGFTDLVEELGHDPLPLLKHCGIDHAMLVNQTGYTTYPQFIQLLDLTARQTQCSNFGLLLSRKQKFSVLGILGLLMEKSPDLRTALKEAVHYFHTHTPGALVELSEEGDIAIVSYQILFDLPGCKHAVDLALGALFSNLPLLVNRKFTLRAVYLQHSAGAHQESYKRFFKAPVTFDHDLNALVFDRKLLELPLDTYDRPSQILLQHNLDDSPLSGHIDVIASIRQLVFTLLPSGRCTLEEVAKQLMMSPRKLQYILAEQQLTFKKVLDEVRMSIVQQQLTESNMPLAQLSSFLGYSEQAAFTRAFKRWFGTTPKAWKKKTGAM